ncbi:MAG: hypothetical protein ACREI3_05040 [Nitrospirales bacterium]
MYEEPYRWIEAVGNRRQYLDEQFAPGSPVVALSYAGGILLLTVSRGTPKLYEVYDRIALGGMGHPADLEKLRFSLLDSAHLEGFNRSPSDVTASRLMKYGLAPIIKQAFEEIFKAPFIVKVVLAELSLKPPTDKGQSHDSFLTVNYDGGFEETRYAAVLASTPAIQGQMTSYLKQATPTPPGTLQQVAEVAARTWAVGSLRQAADQAETDEAPPEHESSTRNQPKASGQPVTDEARLLDHLRDTLQDKYFECAVLERQAPGSSKYRRLTADELARLLPASLRDAIRSGDPS